MVGRIRHTQANSTIVSKDWADMGESDSVNVGMNDLFSWFFETNFERQLLIDGECKETIVVHTSCGSKRICHDRIPMTRGIRVVFSTRL